jgi:uncharacterized protein YlxW (UPF0749 family)
MLKRLGFSQAITTAVPVVLMLSYALVCWGIRGVRIREDRIADNCYYLGLLFTLVSLAYSLYVFDVNGGATNAIITNFGIALATTIVGLALRVFFAQMREDPVEYEREARSELAQASSHLKTELDQAATEFRIFRQTLAQSIEEGLSHIVEKAAETFSEISEKSTETIGSSLGRVGDLTKEAIGRIDIAFEEFGLQATKLNDISKQTVIALEDLFRRIEGVDSSSDLISRKLDPLVERFDVIAKNSERRAKSQSAAFERLEAVAQKALSAADQLGGALASMDGKIHNNAEKLATAMGITAESILQLKPITEETLGRLRSEIEEVSKLAVGRREELVNELTAIKERRAELEEELKTAQALVTRVHSSLSSLANLIVERLDGR